MRFNKTSSIYFVSSLAILLVNSKLKLLPWFLEMDSLLLKDSFSLLVCEEPVVLLKDEFSPALSDVPLLVLEFEYLSLSPLLVLVFILLEVFLPFWLDSE